MTPTSTHRLSLLATALALVLGLAVFAGMGDGADWRVNLVVVLERLIVAGTPAASYVLAGVGLGTLFRPLTRGSRDPLVFEAALGVGMMLWLSHALGSLGLLAGTTGRVVAFVPVIAGLVMLVPALRRARLVRCSPMGIVSAAAIALLLVAAANPPGWLWESEFRGFDALSYHLPLAQEWLLGGRIEGLEHNIYSFLPSAVESAFVHLGVLTLAPTDPESTLPGGLLAGDGWRLITCQYLHAFLAIFAAWCTARAAMLFMPVDSAGRSHAGPIAFALVIATPWMIVTGSLAYNEAPLVAFTVVAIAACVQDGVSPARRGLIVGLLVGAACIVKPTALLFAAVPCAGLLALHITPRDWVRAAIPVAIAGLVMLGPWLIRNTLESGNPVFPQLTSMFGTGHWTPEQVTRYAARHSFDGDWLDRLRLVVLSDPSDPAGPRHRGLLHPQWGIFFGLAFASFAWLTIRPATRRLGLLLLGVLLVQIALWLAFTHIQSRFLMPALGMGAIGIAIVLARLPRPLLVYGLGVFLAGDLLVGAIQIFAAQSARQPNALLVPGPALRTGELLRQAFKERPDPATVDAMLDAASPEVIANTIPRRNGRLYLLGSSTPLYFWPVPLSNTTYDRWPLGDAIRTHPDDPHAWTAHLRSLGVGEAMVDLGEIERLSRWGAADPDVTPERVRAWLATTRPIRAWNDVRIYLEQLPSEPTPSEAGQSP